MAQDSVILIPVEEINILNPRVRNTIIAEEIRQNIQRVGLKRPITVTRLNNEKNGKKYNLVCGQGRFEAYAAAGEKEIPAILRKVSTEDAHIMSLVENIARRNSNSLELLQSIKYLKSIGYEDDKELEKYTTETVRIPRVDFFIAPILAVIPMQLLAYYTSIKRGNDVDKPRNLAKSVTVE